MPILPADFALPALPYLLGLLAAAGAVVVALHRRRPPVTEATVTAMAPWMAAGGVCYAAYQVRIIPSPIAPFASSPAVYCTVGVLAGAVWAAVADRPADGWHRASAPALLAGAGIAGLLVVTLAAVTTTGLGGAGTVVLVGILAGSILTAGVTWLALRSVADVTATGTVGGLVVFGHALDGVSTAVGYGLLGFGEQTPLSRIVLEVGAALPVAGPLGGAWLFVLVKLALAVVVVALFEAYVREDPLEGYLLLGLIAAVGLGPGAHNVVLFAVS